ncbi:rubrerythrin family protein [Streptomyces sp. NBC_00820]|uniref:rubrerythrin family protein n=1 Tax=Streptomyces sp. NBC_00820 TaxID=2975842 RepID=UPI002ED50E42|nr:rubrerythrin family protein [Streptomyces sp. NBC_00820]
MTQPSDGFLKGVHAKLATEALTVQRYTYFAQIAEIEGHTETAKLFRELAASVACVAHGHLDVLRDRLPQTLGDTALNLASSLSEALRDAEGTYPDLTADAFEEGQIDVASWLTTAGALKKAHVAKLDAALRELTDSADRSNALTTVPGGSDD